MKTMRKRVVCLLIALVILEGSAAMAEKTNFSPNGEDEW